ncbi:MAG: hypothetical protein ISR96_05630 [Nitrospira sp.]|nr:hypothetical protein [bacterium]MBL7048979.1 hypothetical protein [Nitrospira sp.]
MKNKTAITGAELITSLGLDAESTWKGILSGDRGIQPYEGSEYKVAARVKGLDAESLGLHPRDSRIMDTHSLMLMKSTREAYSAAGITASRIAPEDIAYFAAMGMVDYRTEDLLQAVLKSLDNDGKLNYNSFYKEGFQNIHPLWPLSMLNNISFCQVAIDLKIKGDNTTFSAHSDSGMHALIEAACSVHEGHSKIALAGGVSEKVSAMNIARSMTFGIMNTETDLCRPFASDRIGTLPGEGSGMVVLETLDDAEKRGIKPLALMTGYGLAFGRPSEGNCASAEAVASASLQALKSAGISPDEIDLLIAHGDGTLEGDKNEILAINKVFKSSLNDLHVYSSKSSLGHLMSGASAVDMVLGIYIMKNDIIPAVYGSYSMDSTAGFRIVQDAPLPKKIRKIMINSQSYEGQCASIILEKYK